MAERHESPHQKGRYRNPGLYRCPECGALYNRSGHRESCERNLQSKIARYCSMSITSKYILTYSTTNRIVSSFYIYPLNWVLFFCEDGKQYLHKGELRSMDRVERVR